MSQVELLAAAREEYTDSEIYPEILQVLQPGNEYLQDLVDQFTRLRSILPELRDCRIACFFELKASNVGRIVGGRERRERMVCFFFFLFFFLFFFKLPCFDLLWNRNLSSTRARDAWIDQKGRKSIRGIVRILI